MNVEGRQDDRGQIRLFLQMAMLKLTSTGLMFSLSALLSNFLKIDGRTFFDPFTIKLRPSDDLFAIVFRPATSLPPLASVIPRQHLFSPVNTGRRYRSFWSGVPKDAIGGAPMAFPPPSPQFTPK